MELNKIKTMNNRYLEPQIQTLDASPKVHFYPEAKPRSIPMICLLNISPAHPLPLEAKACESFNHCHLLSDPLMQNTVLDTRKVKDVRGDKSFKTNRAHCFNSEFIIQSRGLNI